MSTDCLVFKFEEIDVNKDEIDTTLYVLYDKRSHKYLVRGQRKCIGTYKTCPYSYECDCANDLADFIQYVICSFNEVNEILYNYDNLPYNSDEITFEFLQDGDVRDYEISGYNGKKLERDSLSRNLRMLRNVYNNY